MSNESVHHHDHQHSHGVACCAAHARSKPAGSVYGQAHVDPHLKRRLWISLLGFGLLLVAGSIYLIRPEQNELWAFWAFIAAVVVSTPIFLDVLTHFKWKGVQETHFYMDQFVSLAVLACFASGKYVLAALIALILIIGQILEERSIIGVREAVGSLMKLSRLKTRRIRQDGTEEQVDAESLVSGDVLLLRPGETIPADGIIIEGSSTIDQANITGESIPLEVETGANVFAGTTNLTGILRIRVSNTGNSTVLGRVRQIVEDAENSRAPIMRLVDNYARYYTPLILFIALIVFFFTHDVERAISVIIVSIPCAFILSSPTAMVAALACASRLGILVKSTDSFETATKVDTVVFDKTGTLTTGELKVSHIETLGDIKENTLLQLAATLESNSNHPLAKAIVEEANTRSISLLTATDFKETAGKGVSAQIDGQSFQLGRLSWMGISAEALPESWQNSDPISQLYLRRNNELLGRISLSDTLRSDVAEVSEDLYGLGIQRFIMLTGDRQEVARPLAERTGFTEFRAECLPEDKQREVQALREQGHTVMVVGDGVNDAPALASGNVGVAMGALGSDVAIKTAQVALMSNDLRRLSSFIALSRQTFRIINQNIFFGLLFIVFFIVASSLGWVNPVVAALLHELSAFFVIFNSARLLKESDQSLQSYAREGLTSA
jgi:Cd2+/Zn2+-exporting ATPase